MGFKEFLGMKPKAEVLPPLIGESESALRSLLNQPEREIRKYLKSLSHDDLHALEDRLNVIDFSHLPSPQDRLMGLKREGVIIDIKSQRRYSE